MIKKELYTSPEVDVIELRVEGVICQSNYGAPGVPGGDLGLDDPGFDFGSF